MQNIVGTQITKQRNSLGIIQAELARRAGVTPATICQIESGKRMPGISIIVRIAQALVTSIDYLVGVSESPCIDSPNNISEAHTLFRELQRLSERDQEFIKLSIKHLRGK